LLLPKSARVVDPAAVKSARGKFCQVCGKYQESGLHVHHIKTRGSGGGDTPDNLVRLCYECHTRVHAGTLKIETVVVRELPGVEEVLQVFTDYRELTESGQWGQAAALTVLKAGLKMTARQISADTGLSPAMIREMLRTYSAFHDESTRVPDLSFYHHRLASRAENPYEWIQKAAENDWSTRQLDEAMKMAGAVSVKARKEKLLAKAEKAFRMVDEVFAEGGEPSEWLYNNLAKLLALAKAS